jgi:nucleoside phosphorylase
LLVKRRKTLATTAAVIVGALVANGAEKADEGALAVTVEGSGVATVGARYRGGFVAVFF